MNRILSQSFSRLCIIGYDLNTDADALVFNSSILTQNTYKIAAIRGGNKTIPEQWEQNFYVHSIERCFFFSCRFTAPSFSTMYPALQ